MILLGDVRYSAPEVGKHWLGGLCSPRRPPRYAIPGSADLRYVAADLRPGAPRGSHRGGPVPVRPRDLEGVDLESSSDISQREQKSSEVLRGTRLLRVG